MAKFVLGESWRTKRKKKRLAGRQRLFGLSWVAVEFGCRVRLRVRVGLGWVGLELGQVCWVRLIGLRQVGPGWVVGGLR